MEKLIRQSNAARRLGVSERTIRNWERRGLLNRVKTTRPGVWYAVADVSSLESLPVPGGTSHTPHLPETPIFVTQNPMGQGLRSNTLDPVVGDRDLTK